MVNRVLIDGLHHLKPEACRVDKSASFDLFGREAVIFFFVFKKVVGGMMDLPCRL